SSKSLLEFWTCWHITLSEWFRDYVFNPLAASFARIWSSRRALPYVVVSAYFVTFLLMGIWHGSTPVYVVYGLVLGLGISLNKLYQFKMKDWLGKPGHNRLNANPFYQAACQGATFAYFSFGLSCLWLDFGAWRNFYAQRGVPGSL